MISTLHLPSILPYLYWGRLNTSTTVPVLYIDELPVWPPHSSQYWVIRYLLVILIERFSGHWLPVRIVKDLQMTGRHQNIFSCGPATLSNRNVRLLLFLQLLAYTYLYYTYTYLYYTYHYLYYTYTYLYYTYWLYRTPSIVLTAPFLFFWARGKSLNNACRSGWSSR